MRQHRCSRLWPLWLASIAAMPLSAWAQEVTGTWHVPHIRFTQVDAGTLSVRGSQVNFTELGREEDNFTLSCSDFAAHAKNDGRDTSSSMLSIQWGSGIT